MKIKLGLFLILLLAAFLRFYKIDQIPPALTWDEASIGYNAYSITKTGRDEWGESFPLAFKSFGEYKYPLHIYATSVSIFFFGLTSFAVRFPSAFFGVVNILILYFVTNKLTKNKFVALTACFLWAISPWHIQFSRVAWETNFSFLFFLSGLYFFLKSLDKDLIVKKNNRTFFLLLAFILFGVGTYTYNAAKVFIVLFIPVLLLIYKHKENSSFSKRSSTNKCLHTSELGRSKEAEFSSKLENLKKKAAGFEPGEVYRKFLLKQKLALFYGLIIFGIFLSFNLLDSRLSGINRFKQLDFDQAEVVSTTTYQTSKIYSLGKVEIIIKQYLLYFSPKFLFLSGDPNLRHSTQWVGEVFWYELILLGLGIFYLLKNKSKSTLLLFSWLLLAPIPGSFTKEAPHASRAMFMLGSWQIIVSFGLYSLYSKLKSFKKILLIVIFLIVSLGSFQNYFRYYLTEYPSRSSAEWKYGYGQAVNYALKNYQKYDLIVMTRYYGEPQIFTLFYSAIDPQKYQTDPNLQRIQDGDWIRVDKFDKYYFPNLSVDGTRFTDIISSNSTKKILFIGRMGDFPPSLPRLLVIYFLDGSTAFEIVESN